VVLPVSVARTRLSRLGMAPVQEATELAVPPGVAVAAAVGDGGGAEVAATGGDPVACREAGGAAPIPGAVQAPRKSSATSPLRPLPTLLRGTRDNLS